ncbi:MAG TPA: hypothetical protein VEX13_10335, partial [Chloroflexia bacterium]|nr:hypothetical protein [Chloroflexia bacterium]
MAEAYSSTSRHEHAGNDHRADRRPQTQERVSSPATSAYQPVQPALLAGFPPTGRGNGPVRQAMCLQMQRLHGNRATQRFLQ